MISSELVRQNRHWNGKIPKVFPRTAFFKMKEFLPLRHIITITGIRRCGKSSLLWQTISHLLKTGIPAENILFLNLEQLFFLEKRNDPAFLGEILNSYKQLMNPQGEIFVFLDEIQFFPHWQIFLKSEYETSDIKFIITGSNSALLFNEYNSLLSGRSLNIQLFPFSFSEFLSYHGVLFSSELQKISAENDIIRLGKEYCQWGGFFEVFTQPSEMVKREILWSYAKNILFQDIVPRFFIKHFDPLERLFFWCISNTGSVLSVAKLASSLGISSQTVQEYLRYFEDAFLLFRVEKFHTKETERIKSSKKMYASDNGFLQLSTHQREEKGKSLENLVFLQLLSQGKKIHYAKELTEIDFCTEKECIQVAWETENEKILQREITPFSHYQSFFPNAEKKLILAEKNIFSAPKEISIQNAWKEFFLE